MHDDAGVGVAGHRAVGDVAGALGGAAGEQHCIGRLEGGVERGCHGGGVVGDDAAAQRDAAQFLDRGGEHRAVGIEHLAGTDRRARGHQLIAGGDNCDAGGAEHSHLGGADGGQQRDLAGAEPGAEAQHRLAGADVGAGGADGGAGGDGLGDVDLCFALDRLGQLNHHHRVGTARDHAAGGDHGGGAGADRLLRHLAGGEHLGVEPEAAGCVGAGAVEVGRAHGEAVHVGAIEAGHVHGGGEVAGQHAAAAAFEDERFLAERGEREVGAEAGLGLVAADHVEELLLAGGLAEGVARGGRGHGAFRGVKGAVTTAATSSPAA